MNSIEMVRLLIGDQITATNTESTALFKTQEIQAMLVRYGDNADRVAGLCMLIIANDNAKAGRRAQTLNLTIEKTVEGCLKAADKLFSLADKTEGGGFGQSAPVVTKASDHGRPLFHKKGVAGIGDGEISDADATATDDFSMTPE